MGLGGLEGEVADPEGFSPRCNEAGLYWCGVARVDDLLRDVREVRDACVLPEARGAKDVIHRRPREGPRQENTSVLHA
eukprot:14056205-Heterocapsa_arctica.AAC.1